MPRRKPARRRRAPIGTDAREVLSLALDMEYPLKDATNFARAMLLIGMSLSANNDEDGGAIDAVATATLQQLETLRDVWGELIEVTRKSAACRGCTSG